MPNLKSARTRRWLWGLVPLTCAIGVFSFNHVHSASLIVPGDVSGDGVVDISDAVLALQAANGLFTPTADQITAGDVSGDGAIDTSDATAILRGAAGLSSLATADTANVVRLSNAFLNTLSSSQKSAVALPLTKTYAVNWSNLPCGANCHNGLQFSTLSATQLSAAVAVAQAALSAAGYTTFDSIRKADDYLNANGGGNGYGSGIYFIAFLGTPSTTGSWMLQLGGHHFDVNLFYNGGIAAGPTPNFVGVEPQTFTVNGVTYAPLNSRRDAIYGMIQSLTTAEQATAKLSTSFNDVLLGPGQDGKFPAQQGQPVSGLNDAQKALVKAAIEAWVNLAPDDARTTLLSDYENDTALGQTYVAWSKSLTPMVQGSYVRIDGPRVWIEFACQNGVVFRSQIHYHTIWRDKQKDYGGSFTF